MDKFTKQGVRDLNNLGSVDKRDLNGRKDKDFHNCFHIFEEFIDEEHLTFKRCAKCGYEDV